MLADLAGYSPLLWFLLPLVFSASRQFVHTAATMASTYANTRAILQFAEGKAFAQRMAPPTANGTCAGRRPPVCSCSTLAFVGIMGSFI